MNVTCIITCITYTYVCKLTKTDQLPDYDTKRPTGKQTCI